VGQAKEKVVGCFGDIPIYVFGNFGAAKAKWLKVSSLVPCIYIIKMAAAFGGIGGCRYPKYDKLLGTDHLLLQSSDNI
jgi:hypothetical protein